MWPIEGPRLLGKVHHWDKSFRSLQCYQCWADYDSPRHITIGLVLDGRQWLSYLTNGSVGFTADNLFQPWWKLYSTGWFCPDSLECTGRCSLVRINFSQWKLTVARAEEVWTNYTICFPLLGTSCSYVRCPMPSCLVTFPNVVTERSPTVSTYKVSSCFNGSGCEACVISYNGLPIMVYVAPFSRRAGVDTA